MSGLNEDFTKTMKENATKWYQNTVKWLNNQKKNALEKIQQEFKQEEEFEVDSHLQSGVSVGLRNSIQETIDTQFGKLIKKNESINCKPANLFYFTYEARIPPHMQAGEEFSVVLPTGETRSILLPLDGLFENDVILIPYNCYFPESYEINMREKVDNLLQETVDETEDALVKLYKNNNPIEREAYLEVTEHGASINLYDGFFGVQVKSATFAGPHTMLQTNDIITAVNNNRNIRVVKDFESIVQNIPPGDHILLSILRKSQPPIQRCPLLHNLQLLSVQQCMSFYPKCYRCRKKFVNVFSIRGCLKCGCLVCGECYYRLYEKLNSCIISNFPLPDWADLYEEKFGKLLRFDSLDKGTHLKIFWESTGEWWLCEILSYVPNRGHEVLYEEGTGENRRFSKQIIEDMKKYSYKVLGPR